MKKLLFSTLTAAAMTIAPVTAFAGGQPVDPQQTTPPFNPPSAGTPPISIPLAFSTAGNSSTSVSVVRGTPQAQQAAGESLSSFNQSLGSPSRGGGRTISLSQQQVQQAVTILQQLSAQGVAGAADALAALTSGGEGFEIR